MSLSNKLREETNKYFWHDMVNIETAKNKAKLYKSIFVNSKILLTYILKHCGRKYKSRKCAEIHESNRNISIYKLDNYITYKYDNNVIFHSYCYKCGNGWNMQFNKNSFQYMINVTKEILGERGSIFDWRVRNALNFLEYVSVDAVLQLQNDYQSFRNKLKCPADRPSVSRDIQL